MNHEQAFLQAIREHPHDDAPRLIYADWLDEQGGTARTARASFIRIQCRLAELPDDDPARDALEDEAADLLAEYERQWTQPLHDLAEDWQFVRGFVEHIRIRGDNMLTHAEHLFDFAPLRSLHLQIHVQDVPNLAACPQLQWVETLDFSRCQLNDRSLQQLLTSPYLARLGTLNLSGNSINTPGVRALVHSPLFARLRCLDLSRNLGIGDTAVRLLARLDSPVNLEILSLAETNLTPNGLYGLLQLSSLPRLLALNVAGVSSHWIQKIIPLQNPARFNLAAQLRALDLSEIRLPTILPNLLDSLSSNLCDLRLRNIGDGIGYTELLANSPALSNLDWLDLGGNNLGVEGMRTLANSPHLTSLTHLNVRANNIRDAGTKAIAESPHLTRLLELNLEGNGIGGPGMKALAASANLDRLRTLRIASNFVGSESVRALAASSHLGSLRWLDLSDAYLEEESGHLLASAPNLARLTTLLLQKNLLGDGGAKALAQSPHLTRLATLDLNDNRIGKAGAEALAAASWRRMRNLDLRGNVFTDTQEALLRKRFGEAVRL